MYKIISGMIVLLLTATTANAQDYAFQPSAASSTPASTREATLSPQGFANSSASAYQKQQAKVASMAAEKIKESQAQSNSLSPSKPIPQNIPAKAGTLTNQSPTESKTMPAQETREASRPATTTPAAQPANQTPAYTGFQSPAPSSSGTPSSTPTNSGSSWGSGIQY